MTLLTLPKSKKTPNITEQQLFNIVCFAVIVAIVMIPEYCFADDAFQTIHNKVKGWVNGSLGKLITFLAFVVTAFMGVAGYPVKAILGVAMLGLTLASADSLVDMLFTK